MNIAVAVPTCAICEKPVPLEIAKIDEDGQTVHEQCYVLKVQREHVIENRKAGNIRTYPTPRS